MKGWGAVLLIVAILLAIFLIPAYLIGETIDYLEDYNENLRTETGY